MNEIDFSTLTTRWSIFPDRRSYNVFVTVVLLSSFFFYLRYYVMPLHVKLSLLNIQYVHVLVLLENRPFAR